MVLLDPHSIALIWSLLSGTSNLLRRRLFLSPAPRIPLIVLLARLSLVKRFVMHSAEFQPARIAAEDVAAIVDLTRGVFWVETVTVVRHGAEEAADGEFVVPGTMKSALVVARRGSATYVVYVSAEANLFMSSCTTSTSHASAGHSM